MKKIIILLISLILLNLVYAEPLFNYDIRETINLGVPCANEGETCSSAATCNITVFYPDTTIFINNQLMSNQVSFHNYSMNSTVAGEYSVIVFCIDVNETGYTSFTFFVDDTTENLKYIKDTKWFNLPAFDLSTTQGIITLFVFLLIFAGLIIFAEYLRVPILMILVSILGYFAGYLFYVLLSPILGVIFIVFNFGYMLRGILSAYE